MTKKDKKIRKIIDILLKDVKKNAICSKHAFRGAHDFCPDCSACKFILLEGYLEWYKNILEID